MCLEREANFSRAQSLGSSSRTSFRAHSRWRPSPPNEVQAALSCATSFNKKVRAHCQVIPTL